MKAMIRQTLAAALWALAAAAAHAQTTAAPAAPAAQAGPPPGFVVPADPRPDDTAAERTRSQPGNNAPVWRAARNTGAQPGTSTLPGAEKGVLIQSLLQYPGTAYTTAGEAWRQVRNRWIIPYGGSLLLVVLGAIALFYWRRGPMGGHLPATGRRVERFTPFERSAHLLNAASFVVLAVSGLVLAFGKFSLLPLIGATAFGALAYGLKTAHNFVGPLFAVTLLIMIITFVRDNLPRAGDLDWLRTGGSLARGGRETPSHRFNAGEKLLFWAGVLMLGATVVGSGLVLDGLVSGLGELRSQMQVAHMIHAVAATLMMALFMGHIYLGTIGTVGAYQAMRTGWVDEAWAEEHHALWLADIHAGKIPPQRSGKPQPATLTPAEGSR